MSIGHAAVVGIIGVLLGVIVRIIVDLLGAHLSKTTRMLLCVFLIISGSILAGRILSP